VIIGIQPPSCLRQAGSGLLVRAELRENLTLDILLKKLLEKARGLWI